MATPNLMTSAHVTDDLADWSAWRPMSEAPVAAPSAPGVYMARQRVSSEVVYVGMAGERSGRGLRGRLSVYLSGKAAVSGLGEAAMDRALGDADWLTQMLEEARAGTPSRTRIWAAQALARADLEVRWAICGDRAEAIALERLALARLRNSELWNRAR